MVPPLLRSTLFPYTTLFRSQMEAAINLLPQPGDREFAAQKMTSLQGMIDPLDRKSTRLNSSHLGISYAVFCLKKKNESKSDDPITANQKHATDLRSN